MVRNLLAWTILIAVFLAAGEGLNMFRIHIVSWLAFGRLADGVLSLVGLLIAALATAFLGGFIYHRDKKRNKLKREGWRGRPVKGQKPLSFQDGSDHRRLDEMQHDARQS